MGNIIKAKCTQCGFEKEIFAGAGLRDCRTNTILAALPEEKSTQLAEVIQLGAKHISIDRIPSVCNSCGILYALPVVSFTFREKRWRMLGVCPQCKDEEHTELTEEQQMHCPDCGAEISLQKIGHWD